MQCTFHTSFCSDAAGETQGFVVITDIIPIIFTIISVYQSASVAWSLSLFFFPTASGATSVRPSSWVGFGWGRGGGDL